VLANSRAGLAAWGIGARRGRVVYNGFDPERINLCYSGDRAVGGPFTVAMTGRMVPQKDFSSVIRAARVLAGESPAAWRFLLVGSGPSRERLASEAHDLVSVGVVELIDPGLEVLPSIGRAHAGVLMADERLHREGCSNAILEYMACGLPVVASSGGGNPEVVVEGATGYLVPAGDWRALADRLRRLAADRPAAAAMGEEGRLRLRDQFGVERMIERLLAVYEEAVAR
jgi:glycosyltransferase involved in cell wall biosynthesis